MVNYNRSAVNIHCYEFVNIQYEFVNIQYQFDEEGVMMGAGLFSPQMKLTDEAA